MYGGEIGMDSGLQDLVTNIRWQTVMCHYLEFVLIQTKKKINRDRRQWTQLK